MGKIPPSSKNGIIQIKAIKVTKSCKTKEQRKAALRFLTLARRALEPEPRAYFIDRFMHLCHMASTLTKRIEQDERREENKHQKY